MSNMDFTKENLATDLQKENETKVTRTLTSTQKLVRVSMLSALAFGLTFLSTPLPIFPSFLKIDIADVPAVFASILMGPLAGIAVQFIKNLLAYFLQGSLTAGVGEFANFVIGSAMVLPIGLMFKKNKSSKRFVIGAVISVIFTTIFACLLNYYLLLPAYAAAFNTSTDSFVAMGGAIIPFVDTMWEFLLFSIAPFNIFKGTIVFSISYLIYGFIKNIKF